MKRLIFVAGLLFLFAACKNKEDVKRMKFPPPLAKADAAVTEAKISEPAGNDDNDDADGKQLSIVADTSKKLVKNGDIEFETSDLIATRKEILASLRKYGGYVEEDNQSTITDENRKQYELKVRIPAKNFDTFLSSVSLTADKIDSKNISITDSTTRYIDIQTRLNNKKLLEKRYLELLSRASKVSDVLEIQDKLSEIRSDIESTQAQLNYLSKQVAYSSLDITFYTEQSVQSDTGNGAIYKFKKAIADGWEILQNLFFDLITLWPVVLIVVIFYWLIKGWRKRRRAKKAGL